MNFHNDSNSEKFTNVSHDCADDADRGDVDGYEPLPDVRASGNGRWTKNLEGDRDDDCDACRYDDVNVDDS
ncbi:hypothetical protein H1P_6270017 [Hyella patelloides LEGE 07179]|uniref:Uncharacterized protein n=1 Tax=Hyella patelloides LEGE 07179 TaxID=945734 RepID=A0A563W1N7_9CYAN|nr:hypothetical protein [Hyella patelloides]VEP17555.1 hypothetical protein H1P_6270017 [Hyella patelloides LEGE 07179]